MTSYELSKLTDFISGLHTFLIISGLISAVIIICVLVGFYHLCQNVRRNSEHIENIHDMLCLLLPADKMKLHNALREQNGKSELKIVLYDGNGGIIEDVTGNTDE